MSTKTIDIKLTITLDATDMIEELGEAKARELLTRRVKGAFYDSDMDAELLGTMYNVAPNDSHGYPFALRTIKVE